MSAQLSQRCKQFANISLTKYCWLTPFSADASDLMRAGGRGVSSSSNFMTALRCIPGRTSLKTSIVIATEA